MVIIALAGLASLDGHCTGVRGAGARPSPGTGAGLEYKAAYESQKEIAKNYRIKLIFSL